MNTCAFIDIFTTQNDLYGKNNCPIQFRCEIFSEDEIHDKNKFFKPENVYFYPIIPDEKILPVGTLISGIYNNQLTTSEYNGYPLDSALEKIYEILQMLKNKNAYLIGYSFVDFDLEILNKHFVRVLKKEPIEFEKSKLIDLYKIASYSIDVNEIGSFSLDSVFTYYFKDIQKLANFRIHKSTATDIKLTKLILLAMMKGNENLEDFLKRKTPNCHMTHFNFGKYKGASINEIMKIDLQYLNWVLNNKTFKEKSPHIIESVKKIMSSSQV